MNNLLSVISVLSVYSAFSLAVFAQSPPSTESLHRWGALTLFHGLPSNQVRAVVAAPDGMMWFGTDAGLARYDGRRIERVAATGWLAGRIHALQIDESGALWVGTDTGAGRLIGGNFRPISETDGRPITAILVIGPDRAVLAGSEGVIYDCTLRPNGASQVNSITPDKQPRLRIDAQRPLPLTSLARQGSSLIVGTSSRGLLRIPGFLDGALETEEIVSRPRLYFVDVLTVDPAGNLWFGGQTTGEDSGLYQAADLSRPERIGAGLGAVRAIAFDKHRQLWMGGARGAALIENGLVRERFTFENTAGGLRSNEVYAIAVDPEGVVWFGTDRGVCRYDPQSLALETISAASESNFVRALHRTRDGRLWSGTQRGLRVRDSGIWQAIPELAARTVHAVAEDKDGRVLVGATGGLFVQDRIVAGGDFFTRIESTNPAGSESIRAIEVFRGEVYLADFGRGLERLDRDTRALIWADAPQVLSLHAENDSRLWIGTADGRVYVFDGKEVKRVSGFDALNEAAVWAMHSARDGALWLATSNGLFLWKDEKLTVLLGDGDVRAILVEEGDAPTAWCALAREGLIRVRLDPDAGTVVARLDVEQGLPSADVFALLHERTSPDVPTLTIGTSRGLAVYRPNPVAAQLRVVRALGRRLYEPDEVRAGLQLEYPQNSLALDFAAAGSRTFPEQFQYSFLVTDASGRTIDQRLSGDSQLLLESLRPGRYRVTARAFNFDLLPSAPLVVEFEVARAPFPWVSVTLAALLALALGAVVWGARQNRRLRGVNIALGDSNRQLAETRLQLANETESERRRIARDLHDQTLADLRRLMLLADRLPPGTDGDGVDRGAFRREIEGVSTEVRRICEDLSPSVLANVGLVAALEWALTNAVAHLPAEARPELEFTSEDGLDERLRLAPAAQIQIYRIAQEAATNACRHAQAKKIRLSVELSGGRDFRLRLEDDGSGFSPPEDGPTGLGRGLANIRTRASLIDARVTWESIETGGTVFKLVKSGAT